MFDTIMNLIQPYYGTFVRHIAGAWAGYLFAHGLVNADGEKQIAAGIVALGVVGWSLVDKYAKAAISTEFNNLMSQISNRGGGLPA